MEKRSFLLFEVFENVGISDNMKLLLGELWNIAVLPFVHAEEDTEKSTVTTHPDDELSFFSKFTQIQKQGSFRKGYVKIKNKRKLPQELFWTSKSSSRGIHSLLSSQ